MRIALLLLFIAVPLLEVALLMKTGQAIGFWPTVGIVIGTAILGSTLLRRQGFQVLTRVSDELAAGRPPIASLADGAMLLVAGAFLLAPGLITDTIGLLLLVPQVRNVVRQFIVRRILESPAVFVDVFGEETSVRRGPEEPPQRPGRQGPREDGPIIEGEFERLDEKTRDPRR